jgi:hypothetical protein
LIDSKFTTLLFTTTISIDISTQLCGRLSNISCQSNQATFKSFSLSLLLISIINPCNLYF